MSELNFIQKILKSQRENFPDPIFINNNPTFEVKRDPRLDDPEISEKDKPLCVGQYDENSSFCKECDQKDGCECYTDELNEIKERESHSSFEVPRR